MCSMRWLLPLLLLASAAHAQSPSSGRDPYARIIDRSDVVVLGHVLAAGVRGVRDSGSTLPYESPEGFARIAVETWIVGQDTTQMLEMKLGPNDPSLEVLNQLVLSSDRRVILYLVRAVGRWWMAGEPPGVHGHPEWGLEVVSASEALTRVPDIRRQATSASPESLAARSDLIVLGSLDRFADNPTGMTCRVERVISGTSVDSVLTVVTDTPHDLRRGKALLLLTANSDGSWKVVGDGAGCYYLYLDRIAHCAAPPEMVFTRIAASRARRLRGAGR